MTTVFNLAVIWSWIIFIFYWIGGARGVKPVAERQSRLSSMAYRGPLTLGGILLWWPRTPHPLMAALIPHTDLARAGGAVVWVLGLGVAIWSRRTLAGNWSSDVTFKHGHELVERGPYRFARHPIYTGILLMCFGTALAIGQLHNWLGFLIQCAGFWIKLRQEESVMLKHFPDQYPAYRKRVRALVPFVI